jgi:hypothetical protein
MRELLTHAFLEHLERHVLAPGELDGLITRIAARETDPYSAASGILDRALAARQQGSRSTGSGEKQR